MQHILEIAFDFDDDKVKTLAEKAVENDLDKIITDIVTDKIAPMERQRWSDRQERNWNNFNHRLDTAIAKMLDEHKEEILDRASEKLKESLRRTKAWKERYAKVMDDT